jgi:molecular chaperone HtpG
MTTATTPERFVFQADSVKLLDLMINSLYTQKDVFLRELISNASDALDRLRFEAMLRPELVDESHRYEIRLEVNPGTRTLTVNDTGIGMSRDEVITNLGTIARSGTLELRERMRDAPSAAQLADMIGRFGVGFYAAFMVANRVRVVTRRAGESEATEWVSAGDGTFTVSEAARSVAGTSVTLELKAPDEESGIGDYVDRWRLGAIVSRYSDFIAYPIVYRGPAEAPDGESSAAAEGDVILNTMKPIWSRPPAEISLDEYRDFYRHLSRAWTDPAKVIHFKAEGRFEYEALLYIPSQAPYDLYYVAPETGLKLFAKRVLIAERCQEALPRYLRFVEGVVDAADLPLNISRQRLQQDAHLTAICKSLTHKVLSELEAMAEQKPADYAKVWHEFGRALKEGIGSDFDNKERLLGLARFQSSAHPEAVVSLREYVSRMKADQKQILYLTGESRSVVERSPHIEQLLAKEYEVLFLVDPVDELMLQYVSEFDGKPLKSVGKGVVSIDGDIEPDATKEHPPAPSDTLKGLTDYLASRLAAHVKQVRVTNRLTSSPACLVVEEHEYSPMLERVLRSGQAGPKPRRILELNPEHPLTTRMQARHAAGKDDEQLGEAADLLYGIALLAEGSPLEDPVRFSRLTGSALARTL